MSKSGLKYFGALNLRKQPPARRAHPAGREGGSGPRLPELPIFFQLATTPFPLDRCHKGTRVAVERVRCFRPPAELTMPMATKRSSGSSRVCAAVHDRIRPAAVVRRAVARRLLCHGRERQRQRGQRLLSSFRRPARTLATNGKQTSVTSTGVFGRSAQVPSARAAVSMSGSVGPCRLSPSPRGDRRCRQRRARASPGRRSPGGVTRAITGAVMLNST